MQKIIKLLGLIALLLIIAFAIIVIIDYTKYDALINSAPFSALILVRALEFLVPSFLLLGIGLIINKKKK